MRSCEVAEDLRGNCNMETGESLYMNVDGMRVTFPYHDVLFARFDDMVPMEVRENFQVLSERLGPEKLEPGWIDYLRQVWKLRERAGCRYPIDLLTGVFFVIDEHPRARELGIRQFDPLAGDWVDFRDFDCVALRVNTVLGDEVLRDYLTRVLTILIPDGADSYLSRIDLTKSLENIGLGGGVLLDVGCGVGRRVDAWRGGGFRAVGIERQYHPSWYEKQWKNGGSDLHFVRADGRDLPIPPSVVDVVVLEYVVGHITDVALTSVVGEAGRVTKQGGMLVAGPQSGSVGEAWGWRGYRKWGGEWELA